jgi:hypothetical protein
MFAPRGLAGIGRSVREAWRASRGGGPGGGSGGSAGGDGGASK